MTRSTAPRAPAAAPVVRYGVEWFAGGAWSASVRTWETRREAAEEATVPVPAAPGPSTGGEADRC